VNGWESLLPLVLIVLVFWFLVVRPARNQQKRLKETQASVTVGSQVMLGSGLYGTVTALGDDTVQVDLAPGTNVKVARQAVVRVVEDEAPTEPGPAEHGSTDTSAEQD
jgi:preprotein translocase subunit YajC